MNRKEKWPYMLTKKQKNYLKFKYVMDKIVAAAGLIVLSPVFLLLFLAIKIEDGITASVFFEQKRVGENKEYFMIYKYRSMKLDAPRDIPTHLLENPDQYITKVGRFLRKTSLDEIPQLFNILRGDISLIGPRPALWNQEDLIEERDRYGVHQIKPGLTGWAQINGRDELEIPVKAQFDGEYLAHVGIKMDIRCFFGTFRAVLKGEGIAEGAGRESIQKEREQRA